MRLQTQVAPEIQKRLLLSRVEAESLKERDILCPTCGFRIQRVFSDATGHLSVKCQKCKNVHILNLAYFRRIRRMQITLKRNASSATAELLFHF